MKLKGMYCNVCGKDRKEPTKAKQKKLLVDHERGGIFFNWGYQCQVCTEMKRHEENKKLIKAEGRP